MNQYEGSAGRGIEVAALCLAFELLGMTGGAHPSYRQKGACMNTCKLVTCTLVYAGMVYCCSVCYRAEHGDICSTCAQTWPAYTK